jgi:hypothetical protein
MIMRIVVAAAATAPAKIAAHDTAEEPEPASRRPGAVVSIPVIFDILFLPSDLGRSSGRRENRNSVMKFRAFWREPEPQNVSWAVQSSTEVHHMGRGILLWLIGVPIPIILLLAFLR